jgi:glycopeptide antibiotics resistance protein
LYTYYNVVFFGTFLLIGFIVVDFIKYKLKNLVKRAILYSFIFYLLNVIQVTTDGIVFPPQNDFVPIVQMVPFYFIEDWLTHYRSNGFDWFFWNSVKLSMLNVILLLPLGIYLFIWRKLKTLNAMLLVFLSTLVIECSQLIFGYIGIVGGRAFDVDDLILNFIGGCIGYFLMMLISKSSKVRPISEFKFFN